MYELTSAKLPYDRNETLRKYAEAGWELVSVCADTKGNYCGHIAYFKREKS